MEKLKAWVPMALFTPSFLPPTVHQNLPTPFCHIWISVTPKNRNTGFLLFSKITVGQRKFAELATPLYDSSSIVVTGRYDGLTCLQNNKVFFLVLPIIKRFI